MIMKKKLLLLGFSLMCFMGMQVSAEVIVTNIIADFSELDRADNENNSAQQGWNVGGIMDKVSAAKYLVIETEGEGNNKDGFGGIQLIFQGDGDVNVGWTEVPVNDGWTSFARAAGKTISIVIDIENAMGAKYSDFFGCTEWAQILLGYYGGTSAFEALALKNVYLTEGFDKPAGAVNLSENYGFVFEGLIAAELPETENLPMGKDSDLGSGWASSYEAASQTVTFEGSDAGRGWWFASKNCSNYDQAVVKFEPVNFDVKLVVEYVDGTDASVGIATAGSGKVVVDLDEAAKSAVLQMFLQIINDDGGTLKLTEAYLRVGEEPTSISITNSSSIAYYAGNTLFLNNFGSVQIYDINGSILLAKQNVSSVDLSALGKGVYIAKAIINGQAQVIKIIK